MSTDTITTRQTNRPDSSDCRGLRGRRRMTSPSVGSKARATPRVLEVTRLIHSTCAGVSGSTRPKAMALKTISDSPPLVGSMNRMNLRTLS